MLSTVIPVYNEDESLRALHAELSEVAATHRFELDNHLNVTMVRRINRGR